MKKKLIIRITGSLLVLGLISLAILITTSKGSKVSYNLGPEFSHPAIDHIENGQYTRHREYIPLKDGNKIAITYFVPKQSGTNQFPTVLYATPYTTTVYVPEMKWYEKLMSKWATGNWGPVYDGPGPRMINTYTSMGYAIAMMDFRGTGSSTGKRDVYTSTADFHEVLDWLSVQPWSDGNIGMKGQSYLGWAQFFAAASGHPSLKCIAPAMIAFENYTDNTFPGGIKSQTYASVYGDMLNRMNKNIWQPDSEQPSFPSLPVDDLDGDGSYHDEIPILQKGQYFAGDATPQYADGFERKANPYLTLIREREKVLPLAEMIRDASFIDDSLVVDGQLFKFDNGNAHLLKSIKQSEVAVLLIGGFFDYFEGMPQLYASLKETNPAYLFMGPRFHLPVDIPDTYKALFDFQYSFIDEQEIHTLRFFDHYLKGADNGFDREDPVKIYTPFRGWGDYQTWPVENSRYEKMYLAAGNQLAFRATAPDTLTYEVDFTHSSVYGEQQVSPNNGMYFMNDILYREEHDKQCLVFETEALAEDRVMTGYPIVNLRMSADLDNADVYVYLSDVDPDGRAYYIGEAQLRAGWHQLHDNDELVDHAYDIEPELPWHSYRKENYDPKPFANGSYQTIRFNLKPHSWTFRKGHKIRIAIAGADKDVFQFNPANCPDNTLASCRPTSFFIAAGGEEGSFVELPFTD